MNFTRIRKRNASRRRKGTGGEAGFTLVELLVVLVILVLIASIIGPRVIGYLGSSRAKTATCADREPGHRDGALPHRRRAATRHRPRASTRW